MKNKYEKEVQEHVERIARFHKNKRLKGDYERLIQYAIALMIAAQKALDTNKPVI